MENQIWIPQREFVYANISTALSRLVVRYNLKYVKDVPEAFNLLKTIVPVTNADELLKNVQILSGTVDIHAAQAICFTVPANTKRHIIWIARGASVANTALAIKDGTTTFTLQALATTLSSTNIIGVNIKPSWTLEMLNSGNAGDTAITWGALVEDENAY